MKGLLVLDAWHGYEAWRAILQSAYHRVHSEQFIARENIWVTKQVQCLYFCHTIQFVGQGDIWQIDNLEMCLFVQPLRIYIEDMELETCCDKLRIRSGRSHSGPLVAEISAKPAIPVYEIASGTANLQFTSDHTRTRKGFKVIFGK